MSDNSVPTKNAVEIQDWLAAWIATELNVSQDEIEIQEPFVNFGLSSRQAVFMAGALEDWLDQPLDPSLAWDYPSIEKLAAYLVTGTSS